MFNIANFLFSFFITMKTECKYILNMNENILRKLTYSSYYNKTYSLTKVDKSSLNYFIKIKDDDIHYTFNEMFGESTYPYPNREKVYQGNKIVRVNGGCSYNSTMPKYGSGEFSIFDGPLVVKGIMHKGKVIKIKELRITQSNEGKGVFCNNLLTLSKEKALDNLQHIATRVKKGELNLNNLTKVVLKKVYIKLYEQYENPKTLISLFNKLQKYLVK